LGKVLALIEKKLRKQELWKEKKVRTPRIQ
jgi:hypothetical protein